MAIILATANGLFSSTSTWIGGVVPTIGDVAVANTRAIYITTNTTVDEVRNDTSGGATAGGTFYIEPSVTLRANAFAGSSNTACITFSGSSGSFCNFIGNSTGGSVNPSLGINNASTGTIFISGNLIGGSSNVGSGAGNSSTGLLSVTGDIIGGGFGTYGINDSSGNLYIVGNVYGSLASGNGINFNGLNCTIIGNISAGNANALLIGGGNSVVNLRGNIFGREVPAANIQGVDMSNGRLIVRGDVFAGWGGATTPNFGIRISTGYCYVSGDLYGSAFGSNNNAAAAIILNGNGTVDVVGNALSGMATGASGGPGGVIWNTSTGTINITGNVFGNSNANTTYHGAQNSSTGTVNVFGTAFAGNGGIGINNSSTGTIYARRVVANAFGLGSTGLVAAVGMANTQNGRAYVEEIVFGSRGQTPISGPVYIVPRINNTIVTVTTAAGVTNTFYSSLCAANLLPPVSSVRSGVIFNAGASTGTMIVPPASAVQFGVPVDNTTGIAVMTPSSVWNLPLSASLNSNTFGDRLKNASTLQSVGNIIASYNS